MTASAIICEARESHLPSVRAIFNYYVAETVATFEQQPTSLEYWRQRLDDLSERHLPFLVAVRDGQVRGFSYASPWREKPSYRFTAEDSVYVDPRFLGEGIGGQLLDGLIQACSESGLRQLIAVIADTGSPASIAVHRACSFEEVGRLRSVGFKRDRWIDTLLMQCTLEPPTPPRLY